MQNMQEIRKRCKKFTKHARNMQKCKNYAKKLANYADYANHGTNMQNMHRGFCGLRPTVRRSQCSPCLSVSGRACLPLGGGDADCHDVTASCRAGH